MKASEIEVGGEYSYRRGKYTSARKVTVHEAPVYAKNTYSGARTHAFVTYQHPYLNEVVEDLVPLSQIVSTWEEQEEADRRQEEYLKERKREREERVARQQEINQQLAELDLPFEVQIDYHGSSKLVSKRYDGFVAAEELINRIKGGES